MTNYAKLRSLISTHFNKSELRNLAFDLHINHENLPGETLNDLARELVEWCRRHQQVNDLISHCEYLRPKVDWSSIFQKPIRNEVDLRSLPKDDNIQSQGKAFEIVPEQSQSAFKDNSLGLGDNSQRARVDYSNKLLALRNYLEAHNWLEADKETSKVITSFAKRDSYRLLSEDVEKIPLELIIAIDRLWSNFSDDKFGFSSQRKIWSKYSNNPKNFNKVNFEKFGDEVGWRKDGQWLRNREALNNSDKLMTGRFPSLWPHFNDVIKNPYSNWKKRFVYIFFQFFDFISDNN